ALGMLLVIVGGHIDLSVDSILGVVGMIMGVAQTELLPRYLGFDHPAIWIVALAIGVAAGAAIGLLHGLIVAYLEVPAFIVTLGGLLVWRGCAWWVTQGRTVAPMDAAFSRMGGGVEGSIGSGWTWGVAALAFAAIVWHTLHARQRRREVGFATKPVWAECAVAGLACLAVLAVVLIANSYDLPPRVAERIAAARGLAIPPEGLSIAHGLAVPVLIAVGAGVVVTFIATRTRFGRYVFALGGNAEAAKLSGINTRRVTLLIFVLMGTLCAVSAAISTARLNAATNAQGTFDELYVIAAVVIGGTSLGGGLGTVAGAMLGALVMQSLQSGMVLMGLDTPLQNIVVGAVLVIAVWLDRLYRTRTLKGVG
ncbi:MAG: sugar ABC transporter permease, partial [Alphaproteobacteria bacterium]|nr:sugar ABC transporter permease [Alphaproteobacteria bacterium]